MADNLDPSSAGEVVDAVNRLTASVNNNTQSQDRQTQAQERGTGPGANAPVGATAQSFASDVLQGARGTLSSLSSPIRLRGAAAQGAVSMNMGSSRAAAGRAGIAGLGMQAAAFTARGVSQINQQAQAGTPGSITAATGTLSQDNLFNVATMGLYGMFSSQSQNLNVRAAVDQQALGIAQAFSQGALMSGTRASNQELTNAVDAAVALSAMSQMDRRRTQNIVSQRGLVGRDITNRYLGDLEALKDQPWMLGLGKTRAQSEFQAKGLSEDIARQQIDILQKILDTLSQTNAARGTEGNKR